MTPDPLVKYAFCDFSRSVINRLVGRPRPNAEEAEMKRLIGIIVFGLTIGSTSLVLAVCLPIAGGTITTSIARWQTLTGSDGVWVNNLFDGQSGEPTFPQFQEVGFLASGSTWNSATLGTIQDSSTSECDNIEIRSSNQVVDIQQYLFGSPGGEYLREHVYGHLHVWSLSKVLYPADADGIWTIVPALLSTLCERVPKRGHRWE